ncbi:hypothetical protein [Streptomyces albicerus]|nr:hypothetical protein [Streptomyces albicerus]
MTAAAKQGGGLAAPAVRAAGLAGGGSLAVLAGTAVDAAPPP